MWHNCDNIASLWKIQNVIWITECIELGDDCTLNCVDGYKTDDNGCDICDCVDVCEVKHMPNMWSLQIKSQSSHISENCQSVKKAWT